MVSYDSSALLCSVPAHTSLLVNCRHCTGGRPLLRFLSLVDLCDHSRCVWQLFEGEAPTILPQTDPSFPPSTYPLLPACSPLPGLLCLPALLLSLLHGLSLHPHLSPPPLLSLHLLDVWPVVPGLAHRVEDLLHQQQAVRFVAAGDLWQGERIGLGCWMLNTQVNSWNLPTHKM